MQAYGFALIPAGALLVLGVGFTTLATQANSDQPAAIEQSAAESVPTTPIALTGAESKQQMDAALSQWAAENNMEFVPAGPAVVHAEPAREHIVKDDSGGMTIEAHPEGGAPTVVDERKAAESKQGPANRRVRIDSVNDLMKLDREDVDQMERGNFDFNPYEMRDDVNNDLRRLGAEVRRMNQSFHVPATSNSGGTASTGGTRWKQPLTAQQQQQQQRERQWRNLTPRPPVDDQD